MSARGVLSVAGVEWAKLASQLKARLVFVSCAVAPFVFASVIAVQSSLPEDTLFGRAVKDSGFALPLVVLGFAALWAFPALCSVVAGDLFAAEDRYGTWSTVLTRSRTRDEVFAGKLLASLAFAVVAVAILAVCSIGAGALVIGSQPIVGLSGVQFGPASALARVGLAWVSVLPAVAAFTALAVLISVATRSTAAGIGLPVFLGLTLQLAAFVDGPEPLRRTLMTSAFTAWRGLLAEPPFYGPILHGAIVSALYFAVCIAVAYRMLRRRDIGG